MSKFPQKNNPIGMLKLLAPLDRVESNAKLTLFDYKAYTEEHREMFTNKQ